MAGYFPLYKNVNDSTIEGKSFQVHIILPYNGIKKPRSIKAGHWTLGNLWPLLKYHPSLIPTVVAEMILFATIFKLQ